MHSVVGNVALSHSFKIRIRTELLGFSVGKKNRKRYFTKQYLLCCWLLAGGVAYLLLGDLIAVAPRALVIRNGARIRMTAL
jgi:hypothetical protein